MERFLVIHPVPLGSGEAEVREVLGRLARTAHDMGLHAVETVYSTEAGKAYSLIEGADHEAVRDVAERAGVTSFEIYRAEQIHPDLLDEPRRAR